MNNEMGNNTQKCNLLKRKTEIDGLNLYGDFLKLYCTMMKRNLVLFATVVMNVCMAMAQGFSAQDAQELSGMNFDWNAKVVKAAPAAKTTTRATRSVSVNQLASVSSRRNASSTRTTTRRAAAPAPAQQTYAAAPQNDLQSQLNAAAQAGQSSQIIVGVVEHNYIETIDGQTTLEIRQAGMFGGRIRCTMVGYIRPLIEVHKGDYIACVVYFNGVYAYPQVNYSELIDVTGMQRYQQWYAEHYYGGNYQMMLASTPAMGKWSKIMNIVQTGAVATMGIKFLIDTAKSIFK